MDQNLSPDLFLFQRIVIDILDCCKKNIRTNPFEQMNIEQLVKNNKKQQIDIYHQYFLHGLGNNKTREFVSKKYDQLIRDNLINKDYLPPQMITSIINSRSNIGSTASSGSGSVGSALSQQINIERSVHIGKLIGTIMCSTLQPSQQITSGLNFLLEGTKNKTYGNFFYSLTEEVYTSLSKFRYPPTQRFTTYFMNYILNQVQYHEEICPQINQPNNEQAQNNKNSTFNYIDRSAQQKQKKLCTHQKSSSHSSNQQAKFGKCFICQRDANNYDKVLFVPLCSIDCKNKLKRINEECMLNDHFCIFDWLLDILITQTVSDEIVFSLFVRELPENQLNGKQILLIFQNIITHISSSNTILVAPSNIANNNIQSLLLQLPISNLRIIEHIIMIFYQIVRKYPTLCLNQYFHATKIFLYEIIRFIELLPITNSSLQLNIVKLLLEIFEIQAENNFLVIKQLYIKCDCHLFEPNIVERVFNITSQYAVNNYTLISGGNLGGAGSGISVNSSKQQGTLVSMSALSTSSNQISGPIVSGGDGNQFTVNCLEKLLIKLSKVMQEFENDVNWGSQKMIDKNEEWQKIVAQRSLKKHLLSDFIPKFNKKPVKSLKNFDKFPLSPKALSLFFLINLDYESKLKKPYEYIGRAALGELFGSSAELPQKLYGEFLKYLDHQFDKLQIDDCLRITFNTFSLPKQAQQIEVIFNQLSLILEPHLGMKVGDGGTATYQWIMAVLMVQTSTNPNVKEKQKLKLEDFKGLCSRIQGGIDEAKVIQVYGRINKRPLENFMMWKGQDIFTKKYVTEDIVRQREKDTDLICWQWYQQQVKKQALKLSTVSHHSLTPSRESIEEKKQSKTEIEKKKHNQETICEQKMEPKSLQKVEQQAIGEKVEETMEQTMEKKTSQILEDLEEEVSPSKNTIEEEIVTKSSLLNPLALFLTNLWEYFYVSLVNKNNLKGLENICILYGRSGLKNQFQAFFSNLYKIYRDPISLVQSKQLISNHAMLIILRLAIEEGNYILGVNCWLNVIKIIYKLDEDQKFKNSMEKLNEHPYHVYQKQSSDKLFTRSKQLQAKRLKQFLQAMCQFSSSQFKTQKKYTREMYILHHITEIIQYNLNRLSTAASKDYNKSLFQFIWDSMKLYFHSITMHPRKQISLAAIDAYKQLTMKILKKPFLTYEQNAAAHQKLFSVYLYTFQRSSSDIRDFIINVLLNVVSKDMKAGWEQLFNILDGADCADKTVVMRVVERMVSELGFGNIGSLKHLHSILIKQLRLSEAVPSDKLIEHYKSVIRMLWSTTEFINEREIWIDTLLYVKDIYKSSSNNIVLEFFYELCNYCWKLKRIPENQIMKLHDIIYQQVLDIQVHIMELKNSDRFMKALLLLKQLNIEIILKNLGSEDTTIIRSNKKRRKSSVSNSAMNNKSIRKNSSLSGTLINEGIGFLSLWQMFITGSAYPLLFGQFLIEIANKIFQTLLSKKMQNFSMQEILCLKIIFLQWVYKLFMHSFTDQILKLCQEDKDMNLSFEEILKNKNHSSVQSSKHNKIQLIEFSVSSKQYGIKSSQHLMYLEIFKSYWIISSHINTKASNSLEQNYEKIQLLTKQLKQCQKDILQTITESYKIACNVNDKPLLRNFLWHNEFFKISNLESTILPGLLKQEFDTYEIIKQFAIYWVKQNCSGSQFSELVTSIAVGGLSRFSQKMRIYTQKQEVLKKIQSQVEEKPADNFYIQKELLYQDLGLWLTNIQDQILKTAQILSDLTAQNSTDSNNLLKNHLEDILENCLDVMQGIIAKQMNRSIGKLIEIIVQKIY